MHWPVAEIRFVKEFRSSDSLVQGRPCLRSLVEHQLDRRRAEPSTEHSTNQRKVRACQTDSQSSSLAKRQFVCLLGTFFVGVRCKDLGAHMGAIHMNVFSFGADDQHLFDPSLETELMIRGSTSGDV